MRAELEERTRSEVVAAYNSVTRLRVYMRLTLLIAVLFFLANLGGMVVGWLPIDVGVLGLVVAALTATVTVAKHFESVHRTRLYAMELERTLPGEENLDTSSAAAQSLKTLTGAALAVAVLLGAGIVAYSVANAGTQQPVTSFSQVFVPEDEREDDDDDDDDGDDEDGDDQDGADEDSGPEDAGNGVDSDQGEGQEPDQSEGTQADTESGSDTDDGQQDED